MNFLSTLATTFSLSLSPQTKGTLLASLGVLCLSFDSLFIRLADTSGWNIIFWYSLFGSVFLFFYLLYSYGLGLFYIFANHYKLFLLFGLISAVSIHCFILSVTYTSVSNTVFILSTTSFVSAFLSYIFLREKTPMRVLASGLCASAGVVFILQGGVGQGFFLGDLLAVVTTVCLSAVFVFFRAYPKIDHIVGILTGNVLACVAAFWLASPLALASASYIYLFLMGFLLAPLSRIFLNLASRFIVASEMGLIMILESILAPIWVWMALGEEPVRATLLGGAVILFSLVINGYLALREQNS